MTALSLWRTTPRRAVVIFLLAVFFTFASFGFANDAIDLGRQPLLRFGLGVVLTGLFAVAYAGTSTALRGQFWKACIPIFIVQFFVMGSLERWFPDNPRPRNLDAAERARLENRLAFDGLATIAAVCLGYAGFVFVFISEGKRHIRVNTEKATLEAEMAAAREVQQVILPGQGESFPGYLVESVYQPAQQVGGDFFQVLQAGNGGLLLVIGDVAGKGLPAAMLVAMLIGAIRATSEDTHDPVVMLRRLHDRLLGRNYRGFTTALAAYITQHGIVTIANAGHLSPYLDGREVVLPGALPLGVESGGQYEATTFELQPGSRLTFYSDGVVEAQNQQGELLGFERARALSVESAAAIAATAAQFGQSDDITVVTIKRMEDRPAPVSSEKRLMTTPD
jgi:Stage II sporulation protein E (SpoIIE)